MACRSAVRLIDRSGHFGDPGATDMGATALHGS